MTDLILISHNSKKDLERFLPSIAKNTDETAYRITIVDNGSDKETVKFLKQLDGDIIKVIFQKNKGYGAGCNAGAKATSGDTLVFLNCDLTATEDWLNKLEEPLYKEKIAISGAEMWAPNGEQFPTPVKDWVVGSCIAMRRSVYEEFNGFDENFFLFFEETDLCRRVVDKGYKVIRSKARLIHYHPHFPPFNNKLQEYWDQSEEYFKKKHNIKPLILIAIPHYKASEATFMTSLLNLIEYQHRIKEREFELAYVCLPQTVIHDARNKAVELAAIRKADYILFVDNDMAFPPESLEQLYEGIKEKEADIVSGLFFRREPPYHPTSLSMLEIADKVDEVVFTPLQEWPEGLVEIDGTGMAFTLIDMKLFSRLEAPYFLFKEGVGEDLYFCFFAKTKAKAKIYCDTRVHIGHIGRMPVGVETYRSWRTLQKDQKLKDINKLKFKNL